MARAKQLELFAGAVDAAAVHALGLLGWKDPLWTTHFTIPLLDGTLLTLTPLLIRQLHAVARAPTPLPPPPTRPSQTALP